MQSLVFPLAGRTDATQWQTSSNDSNRLDLTIGTTATRQQLPAVIGFQSTPVNAFEDLTVTTDAGRGFSMINRIDGTALPPNAIKARAGAAADVRII